MANRRNTNSTAPDVALDEPLTVDETPATDVDETPAVDVDVDVVDAGVPGEATNAAGITTPAGDALPPVDELDDGTDLRVDALDDDVDDEDVPVDVTGRATWPGSL